ncbi:beta-ketoacyl-[acyl-carrier-protein] synthase family protein [Nocardiopsis alba]|uniref:beta-ketoacyl-[acyl-carrier-protein] synthase family protein n=1 Tax=Nocardiopsis alba TaxID=53437 RepID=UPI0035D80C37
MDGADGLDRSGLLEILAGYGGVSTDEVGGRIDSLQLAWIVHVCQERYGISIDLGDPRISHAQTVDDLVEVLCPEPAAPLPSRPMSPVAITGIGAVCALGEGLEEIGASLAAGRHAFGAVTRFDTTRYRVKTAAHLPGRPELSKILEGVIEQACEDAGLGREDRADAPLFLASHYDTAAARLPREEQAHHSLGGKANEIARACGLGEGGRTHVNACVASNSALADALTLLSSGRARRCVVAAGYLLDEENFALFDIAGAMSEDGLIRPFSVGRQGMLLGDGVAAVVLEVPEAVSGRVRARIEGWGQAGDAHHVARPHPQGRGLARAIGLALSRAGAEPASIGYVNAHGTGTPHNDSSEAAALRAALGEEVARSVPVGSTKSLHGHALVAAGLLELVITVLALEAGELPVNAGYLGPDEECPLNLILERPSPTNVDRALSLNSAFGGAHSALVVGAP